MKLIYLASPYAGDVEKNIEFAKRACSHVINEGHAFFAPHLLYPQLLNDADPAERQVGLSMGLAVLPRCDELWCYGSSISQGMHLEIREAERLGIPVRWVMQQENGFAFGEIKNSTQAEAPALSMGMV